MPCLLAIIVLMFPRVIIVLMWLLTNFLTRAYHHDLLILVLGFLFLPITTIAYAWMVNNGMRIEGSNLLILVVAVLLDAGSHDSGRRSYSQR